MLTQQERVLIRNRVNKTAIAYCNRQRTKEGNRIGASPTMKKALKTTCVDGVSIGIDLILKCFNLVDEGRTTEAGCARTCRTGVIAGINQTAKKCGKLVKKTAGDIKASSTARDSLRKICRQGVIAGIKLQEKLEPLLQEQS